MIIKGRIIQAETPLQILDGIIFNYPASIGAGSGIYIFNGIELSLGLGL
jgi:hypothetical protein